MKRLSFLTLCFCIFSVPVFAQTQDAPGNPRSTPLCDLPDGCEDEALPPSAHPSNDLKYPEDVKKYFDAQQQQAEQHALEKQGLAPNNIGSPTIAAPEQVAPAAQPVAPTPELVPPPAPVAPVVTPAPQPETAPKQPTRVFGGSSPHDPDLDLGMENDPALRGKNKAQKEKVLAAPAPEQPAPIVQEAPKVETAVPPPAPVVETPKVEEKKAEPVPVEKAPEPVVETPKVEPVKAPEPVVEEKKVEPAPVEKPAPVEQPKAEKVEEAKPTPPPAPPVPPPAKPAPSFKSDLPEGWEEVPTLKEGEVPLEKVKRR